jgi:transposase InsO family protein
LIVVVDLASRFIFAPLVTLDPNGEEVAAHLRTVFARHGKPLFLKRDNGSIFNNQHVDQLLAAEAVIPLNSPPYHPRYNGGIEKAIRELSRPQGDRLPQGRAAGLSEANQHSPSAAACPKRPRDGTPLP